MDRPILFSAPMVRALLDGRKTQTRRVLKAAPHWERIPENATWRFTSGYKTTKANPPWMEATTPTSYGATQIHASTRVLARPGDRLWVREAWRTPFTCDDDTPTSFVAALAEVGCSGPNGLVRFEADGCDAWRERYGDQPLGRLRASMHLPRSLSRLTLTVTDVRVQRLQDISEDDAVAEGSQEPSLAPIIGACWSERDAFAKLWQSINGPDSWAANPWVAAYSFSVEHRNIDQGGCPDA